MTPNYLRGLRALAVGALLATAPMLAGCPPAAVTPASLRPPRAQEWFVRAQGEYSRAEMTAAFDSVRQALELVPKDDEVRLLAGHIALSRLEYDEVLRLLLGVKTSQAAALRGRALWYQGELSRAADELEQLLLDPKINDPWAKAIVKLARRGEGRKPFEITVSEGTLAAVEMARVAPGVPLYVVPLEIDGEPALAMVATGTAEVMVDSATRHEPSWISLRFGKRLEVKDVPALTQDLSQISSQLGAPIKALLGANLLRHLNVTLDHRGRQFVARTYVPPAPPVASRIDLYYLRGGGMMMGSTLGTNPGVPASFLVDSSMGHALALTAGGWKKVGVDPMGLQIINGNVRGGSVPALKLGAFEIPEVPAVYGPQLETLQKTLDVGVDGAVGAGLLADFRLTFSDNGRVLWVEESNLSGLDLGPIPGKPQPGKLQPPTGGKTDELLKQPVIMPGAPGPSPTGSTAPKTTPPAGDIDF